MEAKPLPSAPNKELCFKIYNNTPILEVRKHIYDAHKLFGRSKHSNSLTGLEFAYLLLKLGTPDGYRKTPTIIENIETLKKQYLIDE
jgi:hypothetical protein